ncbi:MAG: DNA polymerase I, partial [Flavobacteriales bacterium]|nr:DNA polymerase I [Flavobacteriales bacterium]
MGHEDKRLFLLDAYALIYRAYFSFIKNPRFTSTRLNTSAAFGFTITLLDLIRREKPTHIAVVFDTAGPTERHAEHEEYKANREEMPDDLRSNIPYIRRIIEAFNIPVIESDGYEADDVIGTLAKKAEAEGYTTYMVTPDKDFGQLVTEKILMYKPGRAGAPPEVLGPAEICARWGLERTEQVIDILGLMGDAVDNIPGIPGVGEKTAMKLVAEFGSLEGVLEHSEQLKGKLKERVEQNKDKARMSYKLATILTDAPVEVDHDQLHLDPPDQDKVLEVFSELEFRSLIKNVLGEEASPVAAPVRTGDEGAQMDMFSGESSSAEVGEARGLATIENTDHEYRIASSPEAQERLAAELAALEAFCFDTETTSVDERHAELVGLSFSWKARSGWYVPVPEEKVEARAVLDRFRKALENERIRKVGQNIKYDLIVLAMHGVRLGGPLFDTMLAHYLLQPELRHGMDHMAGTILNYRPIPITQLIGPKGKGQKSMREVPLEEVAEYAVEDADITWQLMEHFAPKLKEDGLLGLFEDMEMPLVRVLADMEMEGIRLDVPALEQFSLELTDE